MKSFLFITPLTPANLLSPLRKRLFGIYLEALENQHYENWNALLIGEHDGTEGRIKYLKTDAVSKTEKLNAAYRYIAQLEVKPDYIIRLDDDDLISPFALRRASTLDFDCYADLYHAFYDLTSSRTSGQKRDWLPNTVIHRYEHAMAAFGEERRPLFTQSHNIAWNAYYSDKNIVFTKRQEPVYLRILSPTTITSRQNADVRGEKVDMVEFSRYLKLFGKWRFFGYADFAAYKEKLILTWEDFSKTKIKRERTLIDLVNDIKWLSR